MGLFNKSKEVEPYEVVKSELKPKDGNLHVMMVNTWNTWTDQKFNCDERYTGELEELISGMQAEGYEIVQMQHNSMSSGSGFGMVTYTTLITYR